MEEDTRFFKDWDENEKFVQNCLNEEGVAQSFREVRL